ncbi:hypothetical protein [Dyadobacter pollutisoli]|uniref:Uncharacterized protein n=1 Tax=Dyadobacter pollutisoli TaxID=2910158 RepID=A0A9E8SMY2_9BACT|nr:hypothetical protein [Dyadobacter pollutisoli]WAC14658.1 hypothetical protein ON006_11990 [Dyadobacter pollutisoli]
MKKSNVFAFIELSKFVETLQNDSRHPNLKEKLKSQSSYFNIIDAKYFSDALMEEWIDLQKTATSSGTMRDENGFVIMNAVRHTIENMTEDECFLLAKRIYSIADKVKKEFE